MTSYTTLIQRIIQEQSLIIGPIAWIEARKVAGLRIENEKTADLSVEGDGKEVVTKLVAQYEKLFGRASLEVCKQAAREIISQSPSEEIPDVLK